MNDVSHGMEGCQMTIRQPEPKIAVSLTYDQWVHVGAAITHALELDCRLPADRQHPLVEYWAEMLRELEQQIEAEPPDHAGSGDVDNGA